MCLGWRRIGGVAILSAGLAAWLGTTVPVFADGATRDLPEHYSPGVTFTVSFALDAPQGTEPTAALDSVPDGWPVDNVSDGGAYLAEFNEVRWGFLIPPYPDTLTYDVTPPGDATGEQCFEGTVYFDATPYPIEGDECVLPEQTRGDFDGDLDVDLGDCAVLADCMGGPETPPSPTPPVTPQECLDAFDFDDDGDVDLSDVAEFQIAFTGPS